MVAQAAVIAVDPGPVATVVDLRRIVGDPVVVIAAATVVETAAVPT